MRRLKLALSMRPPTTGLGARQPWVHQSNHNRAPLSGRQGRTQGAGHHDQGYSAGTVVTRDVDAEENLQLRVDRRSPAPPGGSRVPRWRSSQCPWSSSSGGPGPPPGVGCCPCSEGDGDLASVRPPVGRPFRWRRARTVGRPVLTSEVEPATRHCAGRGGDRGRAGGASSRRTGSDPSWACGPDRLVGARRHHLPHLRMLDPLTGQ